MSENTTELGQWVDQLLHDIFFQPDDRLSQNRIEDGLDSSLKIRINGNALTADEWIKAVIKIRAQHELSSVSSRELLASRGAGNAGGSVAHITTFTLTDKNTGAKKEESSVILATVSLRNDRRVLTELTEVYLAAE